MTVYYNDAIIPVHNLTSRTIEDTVLSVGHEYYISLLNGNDAGKLVEMWMMYDVHYVGKKTRGCTKR